MERVRGVSMLGKDGEDLGTDGGFPMTIEGDVEEDPAG
jgi:hypothetical protein